MSKPFWFRSIQWYSYKRWTAKRRWRAEFLFDRAVRKLQPGDLTIDCGANVGVYTVKMARSGATVHAFEPDPCAFERLAAATREFGNVVLHQAAVGIETGTVRLFRAKDFESDPVYLSQSSSVFGDKRNVSEEAFIDVTQFDIVEFISRLDRNIAILKVDIEGAEVPIFERILEQGLARKIDTAFVETHEGKIPQLEVRTSRLRTEAARAGYNNINFDWH